MSGFRQNNIYIIQVHRNVLFVHQGINVMEKPTHKCYPVISDTNVQIQQNLQNVHQERALILLVYQDAKFVRTVTIVTNQVLHSFALLENMLLTLQINFVLIARLDIIVQMVLSIHVGWVDILKQPHRHVSIVNQAGNVRDKVSLSLEIVPSDLPVEIQLLQSCVLKVPLQLRSIK